MPGKKESSAEMVERGKYGSLIQEDSMANMVDVDHEDYEHYGLARYSDHLKVEFFSLGFTAGISFQLFHQIKAAIIAQRDGGHVGIAEEIVQITERFLVSADEEGGEAAADAFCYAEGPAALLVGPEGGFDDAERAAIRAHPASVAISLGPRILRGETAAIAGISVWMAEAGDWLGEE